MTTWKTTGGNGVGTLGMNVITATASKRGSDGTSLDLKMPWGFTPIAVFATYRKVTYTKPVAEVKNEQGEVTTAEVLEDWVYTDTTTYSVDCTSFKVENNELKCTLATGPKDNDEVSFIVIGRPNSTY